MSTREWGPTLLLAHAGTCHAKVGMEVNPDPGACWQWWWDISDLEKSGSRQKEK